MAEAADRRGNAPVGGQRVHEAGKAKVAAAQGGQRGAEIGQPGQRDRGDLVVPDQRRAGPAEHEAERHDDGDRGHQEDGNDLQEAVIGLAKLLHAMIA